MRKALKRDTAVPLRYDIESGVGQDVVHGFDALYDAQLEGAR
jgi:hypothetical protein